MPSLTFRKLFFVYNISGHFVSIYSFIEVPKAIQANLHFASTLLATWTVATRWNSTVFNPLNPELNPIFYLLALLGAHHFLHVSRIRVRLLNFRLLMSYIYMEHPFLMFLDHTQRRSTVGRTPLDE